MKKAIILAAGQGSRLRPAAGIKHKSLIPIGGQPLIVRQIEILRSFDITDVSVVVGHAADRIRRVLKRQVKYIDNPQYAVTNSLYSLWIALNQWNGPFVLFNCDVLFHPSILERLLMVDGSALAYDSGSGYESEQMSVALKGDHVAALSKDLHPNRVEGENIGIVKFDLAASQLLFQETERLIREGHLKQWASEAISSISKLTPIRAVDISAMPWIEIDFPHDLVDARMNVCPEIPGCSLNGWSEKEYVDQKIA